MCEIHLSHEIKGPDNNNKIVQCDWPRGNAVEVSLKGGSRESNKKEHCQPL